MYRYKETIFNFYLQKYSKKQNLNVDKPKSNLNGKKNNFGFFKFGGLDLHDFDIVTDC